MSDSLKQRQRIIQLVFLITAIVLLVQAFALQVWNSEMSEQAQAITHDDLTIYPSRGLIYDRNKTLLVNNNAMFDLMFTYNQIDSNMDTLKFCQLLGITVAEFEKNINKDWSSNRYSPRKPAIFLKKISAETYASFQEHLYEFPGFFIQVRHVRGYPYPNGAHLLGYLSEVNQMQIDKSEGMYKSGDYIGASGLEYTYEKELKGEKGFATVLKDNVGRVVGKFKGGNEDEPAHAGQNLLTTIDVELQKYGEQLMQNKTGSIVALDPKTGEVLTMISMPTYDPNILTINRYRGNAYNQLVQDSLRPFFDRAVMAEYPPGSIFKTVIGLVAMQRGVTIPERYIRCPGFYNNNGRRHGCHAHTPTFNMERAIQHSCNTYFFTLLRDIVDEFGYSNAHQGMDTLASYLYDFGLGNPLGIDYPNEADGNVPTTEYYDFLYPKNKGSWRSPTILSIGIGQGEIQMTTLQMANLAAIIGNKGFYYPPHLVRGFERNDTLRILDKGIPKRVRIDTSYFQPIINGMENVVLAGTAQNAKIPGLAVCGKTGTSENPHGDDHSVFFAFAPKDDPKIAIAVYVEHGVWGARYASPIASLMIEKYLHGEISDARKFWEKRMLDADLIKP